MTVSPTAWDEARAAEIIAAHKDRAGATLPVLRALQDAFGYVPPETIPMVADALNLSRADVHGVVSFYHDFRPAPPGRAVLKLCRAEACQAMGADKLADAVKQRLKIDWHGTSADGRVTLEPVFCLGLCATGPAAMIGEKPVGRLTAARLNAAIDGATS